MRVNIIGAGRVGQTLGYLLRQHKIALIGGVLNQTKASTEAAIDFIGAGQVCESVYSLPRAELTLITTQDTHIVHMCQALVEAQVLYPGSCIVHCSGVLASNILSIAKTQGLYIASAHPAQTFASPALATLNFPTTPFAVEGDDVALNLIIPLLIALGAKPYRIDSTHKALYHAACVFASNYVITLADIAMHCLMAAGVADAKSLTTKLMHNSVNNLTRLNTTKDALTGPLQRGDLDTIVQHLDSLTATMQGKSVDYTALYAKLGLATLPLTDTDPIKKTAFVETFCDCI